MMGKITQWLNTVPLRLGNTVATPVRIIGEAGNAVANILRQGKSSAKNAAEVGKQTVDALVDNFLNFSKVEGKWYQKMIKVPLNLVSSVTRRPAMIAGASIASGLNQWVREPFKKLLFTPGKMFKWMWNATRIFSKKKGFDFASYDTHETTGDTRVNKIREKGFGFLGAKTWSSSVKEEQIAIKKEKVESKKEEKVESKKEEKVESKKEQKAEEKKEEKVESKKEEKVESKKEEKVESKKEQKAEEKKEKKVEEKENITDKKPEKIQEKKAKEDKNTKKDIEEKIENNPKNIHDLKENNRKQSEKKDKEEQESKEWKHLDWREKAKSEKKFKEMLNDNISEEGVIDRGKKNKKWENIDQILVVLKKEWPAFAGYIEDEIIAKEQSVKKAAA